MFDFVLFLHSQDNATPLYVASRNGHHDAVQTLVGAGADVNIARSDVSDMGLKQVHVHVHIGHQEVILWAPYRIYLKNT